jgi:hypothetical protein
VLRETPRETNLESLCFSLAKLNWQFSLGRADRSCSKASHRDLSFQAYDLTALFPSNVDRRIGKSRVPFWCHVRF